MEQIDWLSLLSEQHIPWIDRGPNTSKGSVNIACPFCGNDPSFHMAISLEGRGYYCYRNASHGGRNYQRLLFALGFPRSAGIELLNHYRTAYALPDPSTPKTRQETKLQREWQRFLPASESPDCLEYLVSRGFPDPARVTVVYDLRYARSGTYARRLLFPLHTQHGLVSFTGRALDNYRQPRYLTAEGGAADLVYVPRRIQKHAVLVEGPFDALKGAVAMERTDFSFIATIGKVITSPKLMALQDFLKNCTSLYLTLDKDVGIKTLFDLEQDLAIVLPRLYKARLSLPETVKDPAELELGELRNWLLGETHATADAG